MKIGPSDLSARGHETLTELLAALDHQWVERHACFTGEASLADRGRTVTVWIAFDEDGHRHFTRGDR